MKVQVIDDERHSLQVMQHLLADISFVEQVKLSHGPKQGLEALAIEQPDVLFLDIHMPNLDGFELLQQIENRPFGVVFISAYDKYAIRAFKVNAFDYLLKPVSESELEACLNRYLTINRSTSPIQYASLLQQLSRPEQRISKIAVHSLRGIKYLPVDQVLYFESEGSMCYAHLRDGTKEAVNMLLKEVQEITSEVGFYRVHRSYLINTAMVREVLTQDHAIAVMTDGSRIDVARRKKAEFFKRMMG